MKKQKPCKVILFGPWPLPYGGVAVHMRDLFENLKLSGMPVKVLAFGDFKPMHGIQKFKFLPLYRYRWALFRALGTASCGDIVHKHSILTAYPVGHEKQIRDFLRIIRFKKLLWIETVHDETLITRYGAFPRETIREFPSYLLQAFKIIVISEKLKVFLVGIGIPEEKISVINSLLPFQPPPTDIDIPEKINVFLDSHSPVITTSGAFSCLYDIKTVVQAFINLKQNFPTAGLVLIVPGFTRDEVYEKEVVSLINQAQADIMLLEDIERTKLLYILKHSSLFIRGVLEESFGLSKIEAILMGTPVVATDAGETRYMTIYKYGESTDLYEKIKTVLKKNLKQDLEEARIFFRKTADENLRRITDIYRTASGA